MKIIDIIIRKATVVNGMSIMCEIMMEDGSQIEDATRSAAAA